MAEPSYGARTIKRERRTRAQVQQLDRQITEVLAIDNPQSVRHVFYRMTDPRLPEPVPKCDTRGYRPVQNRLRTLRKTGAVPYRWVTDATRRGYFTTTFDDPADFLSRMKGLYRADLWREADAYVEVWTESRSIAGVVQPLCEELAVSLYPAGGFASLSLAFEAAEYINLQSGGRPVFIFYIGDYDPAGVLIDVAIERELREHLHPDVELNFTRLAITPEQIAAYRLPTKPRKPGDRRALHVTETVEAEAMPAAVLRAMLRREIEALLPPQALSVAHAEEASAREYFDRLARLGGAA
jgi:hypothetical protein